MKKHSMDEKALLWLNDIELSITKKRELITLADSPYDFYRNLKSLKNKIISISGEEGFNKLSQAVYDKSFEYLEGECTNNIDYITECSDNYPVMLRDIENPPLALYYVGNIKALENISVAIVGTRSMTNYGERAAENFASELARVKITIVSGLAYGIDKIAHEKTLEENGCTIAVLGGGIKVLYPKENTELARRIVTSGGLILSEYSPNKKAMPYYFPERNRIISGLSNGVIIIEAGLKSGALITAKYALDQNRKLFLLPGNIYSKHSEGTNLLIKEGSGIMVTEPKDVFQAFGLSYNSHEEKEIIELDEIETVILKCLEKGEVHIEELLNITKLPINNLNSVLTKLEVCGIIKKLRGNFYTL